MIQRYTRPEMGQLWHEYSRFKFMLEVEIAVAEVQSEFGIIPKSAGLAIKKKAKYSVDEILEIEKVTRHDVIAFVSSVAKNVGENGRYVHYGLTSSDVLDTALAIQISTSAKLINKELLSLILTVKKMIRKYKSSLCPGRTHGMHAEPTTFGFKLAGFLCELERAQKFFVSTVQTECRCKLSGAVGTYSTSPLAVEIKVAKKLKLLPEDIATQVIPRDRLAKVMSGLCYIMQVIERLSVELRHLQRTEVSEVIEGFQPGQKGSSAMPHKKNPISAENLTGLSRLVRGYYLTSLENTSLWHERDISHSSAERVIFADAFIVTDYALSRMVQLLENLYVDENRMKHNLSLSQGMLFSSHVLLHLVDCGYSREEAYAHVQRISHQLQSGESLKSKILSDEILSKVVRKKEIEKIFSGKTHLSTILIKLKKMKLI